MRGETNRSSSGYSSTKNIEESGFPSSTRTENRSEFARDERSVDSLDDGGLSIGNRVVEVGKRERKGNKGFEFECLLFVKARSHVEVYGRGKEREGKASSVLPTAGNRKYCWLSFLHPSRGDPVLRKAVEPSALAHSYRPSDAESSWRLEEGRGRIAFYFLCFNRKRSEMTKAIPVGEPRKRPARACLACRKAKAACVVKEAGEGNEDCCVRCRRNELSCEWVALRKIGRPRRLLRIDSGEVQVNPTLLAKIKRRSTSPLSPPSLGSPGLYDLPRSPLATEVGHTRSLAESTQIASVYAQSIHHFLPLLPSNPTALVSYLRSAPSHLLLAITSLGQGVEVQVPDLVPCLYGIQTSLILVHAFYGQGHVGPAKGLMKWATEAILKLQYQHLDEGNSQLEMSGEERELVRRLWWETWCAEVMLHVVTSSRQFMLQGIPFQVDLPSDSRSPSVRRSSTESIRMTL